LVEQHGQAALPGQSAPDGSDHAFLIADPVEAFAVETAGRHWVYQEMLEVRAAGNASIIRQDWDRISRGLAGNMIERGWWPGDGSKLDFAGTLSRDPMGQASGMRRWGRATSLLEQQNGHIDVGFFRRLLADHYDGTHFEVEPQRSPAGPVPLCQHGHGPDVSITRSSFVAQLSADTSHLPVYWCAFGPPCQSVYLPIFMEGELPRALTGADTSGVRIGPRLAQLHEALRVSSRRGARVHEYFDNLQARFDREVEEFVVEGAALKRNGELKKLAYLAGMFMQHAVERLELTLGEIETFLSTAAATGSRGALMPDS
jgi:secernin